MDRTQTLEDVTFEGLGGGRVMLLITGPGYLSLQPVPESGELVLGRAPECQISISHPKLSRQHAVFVGGDPPRVRDLGSTNGTVVDGRKLSSGEEVVLTPTMRLRIGPLTIMLVGGGKESKEGGGGKASDHVTVSNPATVGNSDMLSEVARSSVNVLIRGETGVGKEVLAEALHTLSARKGPMLRINCAALAESLLENELFGHERGAFTGAGEAKAGLFESAAGGTVLLDEVGEMPPSLQAKLLRVLEAREVMRLGGTKPIKLDVRFLAATHRDLRAEVTRGAFRSDLYYRLNGITLQVPPLRDRSHQIGMLAARFADAAAEKLGYASPARFSPDAVAKLYTHSWPGNVRELKAVVERAVLLSRGGEILPDKILLEAVMPPVAKPGDSTFPGARSAAVTPPGGPPPPAPAPPAESSLSPAELEERHKIIAALDACGGNQTRAAKMLGISRATLVHKLDVYRLPRPRK